MAWTWDKYCDFEEGDTTDFDAEGDVDGDLNAAQVAAKEGDWGIEITFDNATQAWGALYLVGPDQASLSLVLLVNFNTLNLDTNKSVYLVTVRDGATGMASIYVREVAGSYTLSMVALEDGSVATHTHGSTIVNDGDWHRLVFLAKQSSGANDGFYILYLDGALEAAQTNRDNDTIVFDDAVVGMVWTPQVANFGGSFYMDEIGLSNTNLFLQTNAGNLTSAGALGGWSITKVLSGVLAPSGIIGKFVTYHLTGALSSVGSFIKKIKKEFTGSTPNAAFFGTLTKKVKKPLAGTLSFIGNILSKIGLIIKLILHPTPSGVVSIDLTPDADIEVDLSPEANIDLRRS